mmetsp:Transcript_45417/g.95196  ORF Transcript_45417/g.95196 Transcript_45417/m.95196 type:complete len:99 (+) Transcript_45417:701-997(+)
MVRCIIRTRIGKDRNFRPRVSQIKVLEMQRKSPIVDHTIGKTQTGGVPDSRASTFSIQSHRQRLHECKLKRLREQCFSKTGYKWFGRELYSADYMKVS